MQGCLACPELCGPEPQIEKTNFLVRGGGGCLEVLAKRQTKAKSALQKCLLSLHLGEKKKKMDLQHVKRVATQCRCVAFPGGKKSRLATFPRHPLCPLACLASVGTLVIPSIRSCVALVPPGGPIAELRKKWQCCCLSQCLGDNCTKCFPNKAKLCLQKLKLARSGHTPLIPVLRKTGRQADL